MSDIKEMLVDLDQWKVKRLIRKLDAMEGQATGLITLMLSPKDKIPMISSKLTSEQGGAANIKSRVNRQSVQAAIISAQNKLKTYKSVPKNGLVIYCGLVGDKKVSFDFEPSKPVASLYMCDSKFHTSPLKHLLDDDERFGFIVIDGNGVLFGVVCGVKRQVIHSYEVNLPNKHGRGGQSALRYERQTREAHHNHVTRAAELATKFFITNDRPNVSGLILAGCAAPKERLFELNSFDPRLKKAVLKVLDVAYGGNNGFSQAISLSSDIIKNAKLSRERKLLSDYFHAVSMDTGACYGVSATLQAMKAGVVKDLIVHDELEAKHVGELDAKHLDDLEAKDLDEPLVEWLAQNYSRFGCTLHMVSANTQEGSQFVKGFGGLGGILRYKVELHAQNAQDSQDEDFM